MKITDPIIKAAQPKDKAYTIADGEGLALHVQLQSFNKQHSAEY